MSVSPGEESVKLELASARLDNPCTHSNSLRIIHNSHNVFSVVSVSEVDMHSTEVANYDMSSLLQHQANNRKIPVISIPRYGRNYLKCTTHNKRNIVNIATTDNLNKNSSKQPNTYNMGFLNIRSLSPKALLVNEVIRDNNLNVIGLSETWLKPDEFFALNEASPPNYTNAHVARPLKRGGGVALIYNENFNLTPNLNNKYKSFEVLTMRSVTPLPLDLAVIYRPPGPYSDFISEFSEFVADLVTHADNIIIMGDFNIHMNTPSDPQCVALQTIIDSCGITQIIHEPTHRNGNTIDLVLVRGVTTSKVMILQYTKVMSDHYLIKFEVLTLCQQANNNNNCYSGRNINAATTMTLADLLPSVMAPFPNYVGSIDNLTNNFDDALREIIDSIAPLKQKRAPKRRTPWFTEEIRAHKLSCRKLERKWRATKLEVFHQAWSDSLITYKRMLTLAKAKYYSNLIRLNKNDPKFLFSTVASLTQQGTPPSSSTHSADDFMNFFNKKIELIRKEIKDNASQLQLGSINTNTTVYTTDTALQNSLSIFDEVTLEELLQRVSGIKQTTCLLDPLPGKLIKELFVLLGPSVLNIINLSLSSGTVPLAFKKAVIHPLLKRPNLDPDLMVNYRPERNLARLRMHIAFRKLLQETNTAHTRRSES
ncbi:uncharacterized protein LOC133645918 [Entelurus aequoreus]|uniref:uncharacterized protein LOC133645918 n=1 Tax=Entelurus aequoreus TaxID=161455 RepID=UPI002B1D0797|nr:uncharacterized protein LOC133645918 [Entelurus aequoreus]